jgi:hypothetical protein
VTLFFPRGLVGLIGRRRRPEAPLAAAPATP